MFHILKKSSSKGKEEKKKIPKSTQDTIPYRAVHEDGIIETVKGNFSKTLSFSDINYQISKQADQEDIFLDYCQLLNFFDSKTNIEITITNKSIDKSSFENKIMLKEQEDSLNKYRKEYNDMLKKAIIDGRNDLKRDMYLTISIKAEDVDMARRTFIQIQNEIIRDLKKIGSKAEVLTIEERLENLHDFFRKGHEGEFKYDESYLKKSGITTKDLIAPDGFEFKRDYFMIGDQYCRGIFLKNLPAALSDKFLADLTSFSGNMTTSLHFKSIDPDKALRLIKKQITGMESNKIEYEKRSLKNGYLEAFIPYELKSSLEEAGELLDDLINKNQKMFFVSVVIVHFADSLEQLKRDTNALNNIARKYVCSLGVLNYQQEEALKSVLPLGKNYLKISRTLTTESTAILLPFNIQELIQEHGMYYGKNAISKNLLIFNRLALKNPNGFILGTPGSGKSFTAKREMINVLLNTNDDVIIIDPEREYTKLAKHLGGEVIEISAGSGNYLNPLDMTENYSDNENPLCLKSEFIMSLCACLLGGSTATITAAEKTIIDRSLKKTYDKYFDSGFNKEYIPTLNDFQNVLESQNERAAKDLAVALELYTRGSLSVFSNKTNVNIDNRFVIYDTKDLGKQLKTMGLLIVLDNIWNRITENRQKGKRTWIYIDEIYLLFTTDYSANFLFELYKRARKWGGIPTGITQNVEDLLGNDLAKSMLANSDFLMMMNQAPTDRVHLANLLSISEAQLTYITNSNEGEGLLFSGNAIIPFEDKFPKNTELYRIMTTKVDEVAEYKKENSKEIIV
ncbi:VirB4-like conjugal transfer ATPase, CD1110 family [Clostridium arbusti]|uniref:VirB4-like conjugal transfer ATPase, CD1110 family n=1 Tax=Clostridium arbusti TaxID=1137848 RepID=UPI000288C158|nr:ATP-binding protein [Clostridium arbusti]